MKHLLIAALAALLPLAATAQTATEPPLMRWPDLTSRPLPQPQLTVFYGTDDAQRVDVWLPEGEGPFPVVLMVHGGCWQKAIADRTLMNYAAEALRTRGLAVWNVEYRGVDEPGGGYPGTYQDVAAATDSLRLWADDFNLDLNRVAGFGHSAGGHLIAWVASRENLPESSPLSGGDPLRLVGLVNSGGLADLEASEPVTLESCLAVVADQLTGAPSDQRPDVYTDTSPARIAPTTTAQVSLNGARDRIAPPQLGRAYTDGVIARGGVAAYVEIEGEGHVELIAPGTVAFETTAQLLEQMLKR